MLNKFFQSFNKPQENENTSFDDDLYILIYEIIIADHEISPEEIDLSSELLEFYFQIPKSKNEKEFKKLVDNQHFIAGTTVVSTRKETPIPVSAVTVIAVLPAATVLPL